MKKIFLIFFGFLFLFSTDISFAEKPIPKPPSLEMGIVDDSNTFSYQDLILLSDKIQNTPNTPQIGVYVTKTLNGENIEEYTRKVASNWGIGRKDYNDGILFFVAIDDRNMRIEVAENIQDRMTDLRSKEILEKVSTDFKKNDYFSGLSIGISEIRKIINTDYDAIPKITVKDTSSNTPFFWGILMTILFGIRSIYKNILNIFTNKKNQRYVRENEISINNFYQNYIPELVSKNNNLINKINNFDKTHPVSKEEITRFNKYEILQKQLAELYILESRMDQKIKEISSASRRKVNNSSGDPGGGFLLGSVLGGVLGSGQGRSSGGSYGGGGGFNGGGSSSRW